MNLILQNDDVFLELSRENGSIVTYENKKTGWNLIAQPKLAGLFRLLVPVEKHRNNKVLSSRLQNCVCEKITDTEAELRWHGVTADHSGRLDIHVTVRIVLSGDQVTFTMSLKNDTPYRIEEAWCPCLGGVREPKGGKALAALTQDMCGGFHPVTLGDGFPQACGYWGTDYPTFIKAYGTEMMQLPYELLENGSQGLYLGLHADEQELIAFVHELYPGYSDSKHSRVPQKDEIGGHPAGYGVGAAQLPFLEPGGERTLQPVVLRLYEGDWHEGLKPYLQWRQNWYVQRPKPHWLREVDCWLTLHINSPEGCCRYRYSELPGILRKAKEHGVQLLQLIGWSAGGQDGGEPCQDTDPLLGTREELKAAIREIEEMGIRVLLMCKFKWTDQSIPSYEAKWRAHTMKDMYGNPVQFPGYAYQTITQQLYGGSRRCGAALCHSSTAYRRDIMKELDKILELGPSGLMYDELMDDRLLCFDPGHDHPWGESDLKGSLKLAEEMLAHAREKNSDFVLVGESPSDALSQFYPVSYVRTEDGRWADPIHRPVYRYLNPDLQIATCLTGFDDREMVNQCLVFGYAINFEPYNFKGTTEDIPDTVRYSQQVRKLRRRLWNYLWEGTFTHTVGATVTSRSDTEFIYSMFTDPKTGGRAVAIANQDEKAPLKVSAALDGGKREYFLHRPETEEIVLCRGDLTIAPRSLAVLVETI